MSLITRKGLEFLINQFGKAKYAYKNLIGDFSFNRGLFSELERTVVKFRGSTIFHDYDLSLKNNLGVNQSPFQSYNEVDPVLFGFQGGKYVVDKTLSGFANTGGWTAQTYNPPTPEGWEVLDYNAWSNYIPPFTASGTANTGYIIYNINSEPGSGQSRSNFSYPVRYTGTGYTQVNLFNSSRWISVKNNSGSSSANEAHLIIPKSYFDGIQKINPYTNTPVDLGIYSHIYLKTAGVGSTFSLAGSMSGIALSSLAYSISEVSSTGATTGRNRNHYLLKVKLPSTTWNDGYWFHLGFYWNTHDLTFKTNYPTYSSGTALTYNNSSLNTSWFIYNRKNYFEKTLSSQLTFDKTGVNDTNIYLFSKNKSGLEFYDGDNVSNQESFRYLYPEVFDISSIGNSNSLSNVINLEKDEFYPIIIAAKNYGNDYENGKSVITCFVGKAQPLDALPSNLDDYENYPSVPSDYDVVAKVLASYPSNQNSGVGISLSGSIYGNNSSVIYIKNESENFAIPPVGDYYVGNYILPKLLETVTTIRNDKYSGILDVPSSATIPSFVNFSFGKNTTILANNFSNTRNAKLLHNLLKVPTVNLLKSNSQLFVGLGKITISAGTLNVIGSVTFFTKQINSGDYILDENGIVIGKVSSVINDTYLLLEETVKISYSQINFKIQNNIDETEPVEIPMEIDGVKSISDWANIPPTINFASINSSGASIENNKLNRNSTFEIYFQKSNLDNLNDQNQSGTKLSKDYTFKIKFADNNENFIYKTLFVNASKFFISDDEYQDRINKNLSIDGYFKYGTDAERSSNATGTFNSIEDYRLYGTSAVIPDLSMGSSKVITSKQFAPADNTKISKADYIASLKTSNPNITQTEINQKISEYELTKSFYTTDTSSVSNQFSRVDDFGVTITEYTDSDIYWINNQNEAIGSTNQNLIYAPKHILDLRSDSFVISNAGYTTTDNSINRLDNIYNQQVKISSTSQINQETAAGYQSVIYPKFAIKINPVATQDIKSFKIKLQNLSLWKNPDAFIQCSIWTNKDGLPNKKLATGSKVFFSEIKNKLDDVYFYLNYKLIKDETYWIVFENNSLPPAYDQKTSGLINVSGTAISGVYNATFNTFTNFLDYKPNAQIGFGSSSYQNISTWYTIASIASTTAMTISGNGGTFFNQPYVVKYDFRLSTLQSSITVSTPKNLAYFDDVNWNLLGGTAYIVFLSQDDEIYGAFNKDFKYSNLMLPEPNDNRTSNNYVVDGYYSYNAKELSEPANLYIYPRNILNRVVGLATSGVSGNTFLSIHENDYDKSVLAGLAVTGTFISSGTLVTSIDYDNSTGLYNLRLNSALSGTFTSSVRYFGDDKTRLIPRANDIYVYLKYLVNDNVTEKYVTLDKYPTWITKWYLKNAETYYDFDNLVNSSLITTSYKFDYNNFSGLGQSYYINGSAVGKFITKSSIGSTFDFRITSSGGVKLIIDDEAEPSINQWTNSSLTSYTCSHVATGSSQPIKLEIQFDNNENTPIFKAEWRVTGTSTWNQIDDSFYFTPGLDPVLIDSGLIQNILQISVGKSLSEISDENHGYSVTDKLVFRNK